MQKREIHRKDMIIINKPTYYLWRDHFSTQEDFDTAKERFTRIGFRVVTYLDSQPSNDIHIGMKALIRNHWGDDTGRGII